MAYDMKTKKIVKQKNIFFLFVFYRILSKSNKKADPKMKKIFFLFFCIALFSTLKKDGVAEEVLPSSYNETPRQELIMENRDNPPFLAPKQRNLRIKTPEESAPSSARKQRNLRIKTPEKADPSAIRKQRNLRIKPLNENKEEELLSE